MDYDRVAGGVSGVVFACSAASRQLWLDPPRFASISVLRWTASALRWGRLGLGAVAAAGGGWSALCWSVLCWFGLCWFVVLGAVLGGVVVGSVVLAVVLSA